MVCAFYWVSTGLINLNNRTFRYIDQWLYNDIDSFIQAVKDQGLLADLQYIDLLLAECTVGYNINHIAVKHSPARDLHRITGDLSVKRGAKVLPLIQRILTIVLYTDKYAYRL